MLQNVTQDVHGLSFLLQNLQNIIESEKGYLPLNLTSPATKTNICSDNDLKNESLIFLRKSFDDDCTVHLDKNTLIIYRTKKKN